MDFISFSLNYWDDLWQSRHQVMSLLAKNHKVLFVSPPFSRAQVFGPERHKLPASGVVRRCDNLYTLVFPKWLFELYRYPRVGKILTYLRERHVRKIIRKLGFRDVVLFIWHPHFADLVGGFGEAVSCYYADDEFASFAGLSERARNQVLQQEDKLLSHVDLVFASGPALMDKKNHYGNAINVPMGADFELFSKSRAAETPVPEDLEAVPHPRIGHIGNLNDKIDFRLVLEMSEARPNWSFVLVGPLTVRSAGFREDVGLLRKRPNVYLLGSKPRNLLPNYIKGLDVCMMCYRTDGWAQFIYPLKLHEYLASGKPAIGPPLMSLRDFTEVVRIADTPEKWVAGIEAALQDHDAALAQRRIQVAYENRLEKRIETIEEALERKLREKRNGNSARSGG
jgi:glycosyltransferase involved in cell wall biosynthesis